MALTLLACADSSTNTRNILQLWGNSLESIMLFYVLWDLRLPSLFWRGHSKVEQLWARPFNGQTAAGIDYVTSVSQWEALKKYASGMDISVDKHCDSMTYLAQRAKSVNIIFDCLLHWFVLKIDRVGLVDDRPCTDKLHLFVQKKFKKRRRKNYNKKITFDTWHTWHVTPDMWHMVRDEHSLKISAPLLFWFGNDSVLKIFEQKDHSINYNGGDCRTAPATKGLLKTRRGRPD